VAALFGATLRLFDADGAPRGTVALDDGNVHDVAYDELNDLAFVTGFNQVSGDLQQPFLRAYSPDGTVAWLAYDWTNSEAMSNGSSSDTRGYGVAMGRDGKLYYVGEGHGGVSTHRFMPRDLATPAPLVKYDAYNDPYNLNGAAPIGFVGRFDPATGALLAAQFAVTRLSSGKGNAVRHRAVAADADGTVIIGGASACCIEGGADKTINGVPAMPGYAGGGYLLVLSPDLGERLVWTAWTGDSGGAEVSGVAAWNGVMAMVETQSADRDTGMLSGTLVTSRALQSAPGGGPSDGFLAVWPGE